MATQYLQLDGETSAAGADEKSILLVNADGGVVAHLPCPSPLKSGEKSGAGNAPHMLACCNNVVEWNLEDGRLSWLCYLSMILCPTIVGGCCSQGRGCRRRTIEVVDTDTHVGEWSLLISERELQGL
jgi:hypothetical protein